MEIDVNHYKPNYFILMNHISKKAIFLKIPNVGEDLKLRNYKHFVQLSVINLFKWIE